MKARSALIQGVLAGAGLVAAYVTWQRPKDTKSDEQVVVLDAKKTALEEIRYEDGTRFITLRREVKDEPVVWVTQGYLEGKGPPPVVDPHAGVTGPDGGGHADAGLVAMRFDAGMPEGVELPQGVTVVTPPPRQLVGNERAEKLYEKFSPLMAARGLGVLSPEKTKEVGLDLTEKKMTLMVSGAPRIYRVSTGGVGLLGNYLQDGQDNQVYLLPSGLMNELDPSSGQLIDRRFHAFRPAEFDSFKVTFEGVSKEFVQTGAEVSQTTKVAPKEAPDKPDEFVRNWHDKILTRMVPTDVLGKGETPKSGEPTLMLRLDYFSHGKPKGFLEMAKGAGSQVEIFARSEHTAGWVALHMGSENFAEEARKVVGK
ncbi:MAG: hypothetical protein K1X64_04920 [Myxococcaceae bacterium]|nr:hypothetical protein [Myxococcaceae bacterium]